jgi:hypothetical protein
MTRRVGHNQDWRNFSPFRIGAVPRDESSQKSLSSKSIATPREFVDENFLAENRTQRWLRHQSGVNFQCPLRWHGGFGLAIPRVA